MGGSCHLTRSGQIAKTVFQMIFYFWHKYKKCEGKESTIVGIGYSVRYDSLRYKQFQKSLKVVANRKVNLLLLNVPNAAST